MEEMKVTKVELKMVDRPKDPVRTKIDGDKIRELAESIREV